MPVAEFVVLLKAGIYRKNITAYKAMETPVNNY
jgi:hypothetical protein